MHRRERFSSSTPFQFTPLREGRLGICSSHCADKDFNSRPSARGDKFRLHSINVWIEFQFTPLREGRPTFCANGAHEGDFNSRPSARGDPSTPKSDYSTYISIHAPPRGATDADDADDATLPFQFTPLREGRPDVQDAYTKAETFQFTPLREGRPGGSAVIFWIPYFNSRPSTRGDGA